MAKPHTRSDWTSLAGILVAAGCVLGGLLLEKGEFRDLTQVSAAVIVFGGTCGALVVSTPKQALRKALRRMSSLFRSVPMNQAHLLDQIVRLADVARRGGFPALEGEAEKTEDLFLKKSILLLADEVPESDLKRILETDLIIQEESAENDARVFEAAGAYAPTIGIIGAVLGLVQVMKHLDNLQDVGRGIAVAFVATLYGVGLANIVLLPFGSKIRAQARQSSHWREMIIEGVLQIREMKNPRLIRQLLQPFLESDDVREQPADAGRGPRALRRAS
jgi:chemotaxis protein MotA